MAPDLYNPAALCGLLETEYGRLTAAITALGLEPEVRLNGVPYFSAEGAAEIRRALQTVNAKSGRGKKGVSREQVRRTLSNNPLGFQM